jgi:hypothetical protein
VVVLAVLTKIPTSRARRDTSLGMTYMEWTVARGLCNPTHGILGHVVDVEHLRQRPGPVLALGPAQSHSRLVRTQGPQRFGSTAGHSTTAARPWGNSIYPEVQYNQQGRAFTMAGIHVDQCLKCLEGHATRHGAKLQDEGLVAPADVVPVQPLVNLLHTKRLPAVEA